MKIFYNDFFTGFNLTRRKKLLLANLQCCKTIFCPLRQNSTKNSNLFYFSFNFNLEGLTLFLIEF